MNAVITPSAFGSLARAASNTFGIELSNNRSPDRPEIESSMVAADSDCLQNREENIARLAETAYRAVLALGYRGSFLDLELSLWNAIRQAVEQQAVEFVSKEAA